MHSHGVSTVEYVATLQLLNLACVVAVVYSKVAMVRVEDEYYQKATEFL